MSSQLHQIVRKTNDLTATIRSLAYLKDNIFNNRKLFIEAENPNGTGYGLIPLTSNEHSLSEEAKNAIIASIDLPLSKARAELDALEAAVNDVRF